ncbi:DUF551 domain-containing protein [Klebsiella pneumoniae]|uniref:DUF551 domain-containing protein n=1 Tax=Klebsiella pneumoniae TaxID=573 RepID=UPI0010337A46|nr:DUF551 domain-containing protein [Klebsiella pneumoniae]
MKFEEWLSQQNGVIEVDCGCVTTEAFYHWMRVAYEAGNSPAIPDGYVMVPDDLKEAAADLLATLDDYPEQLVPINRDSSVVRALRAAMLAAAQQSPGSEPDTVPGKWIPVSERLPEEGGRYWCYVEEQNSLGKSHYQWNCSWNEGAWSDKALTGRVTHWMPLPAAPQEVKSE